MSEAKAVVDLDKALGLTRDGAGEIRPSFKYRFVKIRFPSQKVRLPNTKTDIEFRVTRQNDPSQGAPVGVFETNDDAIAEELVKAAESDPSIVQTT